MRLEIWPQADIDLDHIIAHYNAVSPEVLPDVLADIDRALDRICEFPKAYRKQSGRAYRLHVTSRYRFKIVYQDFPDRVEVIGIFRLQNRKS